MYFDLNSTLAATIPYLFNLRFFSNFFGSGLGFQLRYESSDGSNWSYGACEGHVSTPQGIITSPLYPDNYPSNANCIYTITQPTGTVILLKFYAMDIHNDYCHDYLKINDGSSRDSPPIGKLCGSDIPAPIQSSQNALWIE